MARLDIRIDQIKDNIQKLSGFLSKNHIQWTLVAKVAAGNPNLLRALLSIPGLKEQIHSIAASHVDSLRAMKSFDPTIPTMYIKPPSLTEIPKVIQYADISLNTNFHTIAALQREARSQGKVHKIIIMIEMGELREGILRENLVRFYGKVFNLSNIEVIGLGTNLGCMHGIEPTYDKLIQLSLFEQLIEARFNHKLELVSGGSSITLPLIKRGRMPVGVNHFRIGEAAFLGTSPLDGKKYLNLNRDAFLFHSHIVELYRKDIAPDGVIGEGNIGHTAQTPVVSGKSFKAVMDFGILDTPHEHLSPINPKIQFVGNSSDMTVYDMGSNPNNKRVGDILTFQPDYMGVANLMGSRFIEKQILE